MYCRNPSIPFDPNNQGWGFDYQQTSGRHVSKEKEDD